MVRILMLLLPRELKNGVNNTDFHIIIYSIIFSTPLLKVLDKRQKEVIFGIKPWKSSYSGVENPVESVEKV